jgi:hypothetical protein
MEILIVLSAITLLSVYLANGMAVRRDRSPKLWVALAVLFGPFAVITLKFLPRKARAFA